MVYKSSRQTVIGNINAQKGDPVVETLTLDADERIVGVRFQKPKEYAYL